MRWLHQLAARVNKWRGVSPARERAHHVDFERLSIILGYRIRNTQLFIQALSHRSYFQSENKGALASNERLEFLGDSILNLVVAKHLFDQHASAPEGDLTKNRARLVNRKSLSVYARQIQLEDFMLIGAGASRTDGRGMTSILADAFEALVAAMYLDGGYEEAKRFIERQIHSALRSGKVKTEDENFKSQLLEYAQAEGANNPRYVPIKEEGPDHDRIFTVEVYLGTDPYGVGMGKNKKDAEQAAAEKALQKLGLI